MAAKVTNYYVRNGKYYARITFYDDRGKRRQKTALAESKADVPRAARELRNKLERNGPDALFSAHVTLDKYLDDWLANIKLSVSVRTYDDYSNVLKRYVRGPLGRKQVSKVQTGDIQRIVNEMKLSPRTVRYMHTVLSSALKAAIKPPWKLLTFNPADYVTLPKQEHKERQWLTEELAKKFLAALSKDKYGLMFELALVTGLRPEEYLALKWTDFEPERQTITVNRVLYRNRKGGGYSFPEPKTKKSRRTIPLPFSLVQRFSLYKSTQAEERLKLGPEWEDNNLIFCSETGSPLMLWNIHRRHFKPLLEKAGLPDMRLYDLRHSCATLLLKARENLKVVSERLGHSSTKITADVYQHVDESMQRAATEKLESILSR
jgi:integrase